MNWTKERDNNITGGILDECDAENTLENAPGEDNSIAEMLGNIGEAVPVALS